MTRMVDIMVVASVRADNVMEGDVMMVDATMVSMTMVTVMITVGRMGMVSNKGILVVTVDMTAVEEDVGESKMAGVGNTMKDKEEYV
jgi:hypothetical protein